MLELYPKIKIKRIQCDRLTKKMKQIKLDRLSIAVSCGLTGFKNFKNQRAGKSNL